MKFRSIRVSYIKTFFLVIIFLNHHAGLWSSIFLQFSVIYHENIIDFVILPLTKKSLKDEHFVFTFLSISKQDEKNYEWFILDSELSCF